MCPLSRTETVNIGYNKVFQKIRLHCLVLEICGTLSPYSSHWGKSLIPNCVFPGTVKASSKQEIVRIGWWSKYLRPSLLSHMLSFEHARVYRFDATAREVSSDHTD